MDAPFRQVYVYPLPSLREKVLDEDGVVCIAYDPDAVGERSRCVGKIFTALMLLDFAGNVSLLLIGILGWRLMQHESEPVLRLIEHAA